MSVRLIMCARPATASTASSFTIGQIGAIVGKARRDLPTKDHLRRNVVRRRTRRHSLLLSPSLEVTGFENSVRRANLTRLIRSSDSISSRARPNQKRILRSSTMAR
jgi:hypothetical protein